MTDHRDEFNLPVRSECFPEEEVFSGGARAHDELSKQTITVLDHGFVRLDAALANDLSVVNSARVSFAKRTEVLRDEDAGLIKYLLINKHGTPFEHNLFRFHVKCPIVLAREWMRHRIGSFNEWSGRYSKLEREFYIPREARTQEGKPGAYNFTAMDDWATDEMQNELAYSYNVSWEVYERLLEAGVAKEQARLVLPVGVYTQFYWSVNARSLMNFLNLRNSPHAMYEIRQYARSIETIFKEWMPLTYSAFIDNDRIAP